MCSSKDQASAAYTEVTRSNIRGLATSIRDHIARSGFVAIDTEFTGLGLAYASPTFAFTTADWYTRSVDMRERYRAMANVARTHALASLGLSVFSNQRRRRYTVHNYNFLLHAQNTHLVSPTSIAFLAQSGFDLNRQATGGIRYFAGPNPDPPLSKDRALTEEGALIRGIFFALARANVPLVVHNGLFDLVYLYQSFFGPLPDNYNSFVYDLHNLFPAGIYDTKFMTESLTPGSASYLAYVYHKSERIQKKCQDQDSGAAFFVTVKQTPVKPKPKSTALQKQTPTPPVDDDGPPYCVQFATHGHCRFNDRCRHSHDINFILDCQEKEELERDQRQQQLQKQEGGEGEAVAEEPASNGKQKLDADDTDASKGKQKLDADGSKGKRKLDDADDSTATPPSKTLKAMDLSAQPPKAAPDPQPPTKACRAADPARTNMYHTAAYDAFMTGYIFATFRALSPEKLDALKDKLFLMGRPGEPLLVQASAYATSSITFRQTMHLVRESAP